MSHFDELLKRTPDLKSRRILDIGSGRGKFLVDAARNGASVSGLEPFDEYRAEAERRATEAGVSIRQTGGAAESLPFSDGSFDFINMTEVVEHVENPHAALREAARVLAEGGEGYVSVPSRYGWFDPHYKLPFVNWMPRAWSPHIADAIRPDRARMQNAGRQRLLDMHYATYGEAVRMLRAAGFDAFDIREGKMRARVPAPLFGAALFLYRLARPFAFTTFHFSVAKR